MAFGRLSRPRPEASPFSDINVTPLVDVMLVLLVIFILTAPLMMGSLRLDLPQAQSAQPLPPSASVTLGLDARGQRYFNDTPVDATALAARLQALARQQPEAEVQLQVDAAVPHGQVVALMDAVQKAGLSRIGFVAQPASR